MSMYRDFKDAVMVWFNLQEFLQCAEHNFFIQTAEWKTLGAT